MNGTPQQGMRSLAGTAQNWFYGLPFCTKVTFSLITGIFVLQRLTGWYGSYDHAVSLIPNSVLFDFQVYRICTAVLVHGGLLHLVFNMLAFVPIASSVERGVGTLQLLYFLLLCSVLEGVFYVVFSAVLAISGLIPDALYRGVVGFSGVIFGLIVWEVALSGAPYRSIFGLFSLPSAWYPWGLLLFFQLLMPEASFFGHLAGLMVGQLWVWGYLRPLALSRNTTAWLEQSWLLARCARLHSFILMPSSNLPYTAYDTARGGGGSGGTGSGSGGSGNGWLGRHVAALGQLLQRRGTEGEGGGAGSGGGSGGLGGDDVEGGGAGGNQGPSFAGTGRVLGGGAVASTSAQPPSVAAALAAEARMKGGAAGSGSGASALSVGGGASSSGGGGGGAGVGPSGARDKTAK